jgi:hypothetical protein
MSKKPSLWPRRMSLERSTYLGAVSSRYCVRLPGESRNNDIVHVKGCVLDCLLVPVPRFVLKSCLVLIHDLSGMSRKLSKTMPTDTTLLSNEIMSTCLNGPSSPSALEVFVFLQGLDKTSNRSFHQRPCSLEKMHRGCCLRTPTQRPYVSAHHQCQGPCNETHASQISFANPV